MKITNKKKKRKKLIVKLVLFFFIGVIIIISILTIPKFERTNDRSNTINKKNVYVKTEDYKEQEKKEIAYKNNENKFLGGNNLYFEDPKTGVQLPIFTVKNVKDKNEEEEKLSMGIITQKGVDVPGKNNFVISGHNDYYGNYLTPEISSLKKGDDIFIFQNKDNKKIKYTYKITKKEIINKKETSLVYFKSDKPIIHLITCKHWYKTDERIVWSGVLKKTETVSNDTD